MSDLNQFYSLRTFQWSKPDAENPRLSAPISASTTTVYVTNAPYDEDDTVVTGDFLMGVANSEGYTESVFVPSGTLAYDAQSANFTVGSILTGGTSGATAYIIADTDAGATGTLTLAFVSGTFQNDEAITDVDGGAAVANGTLTNSVSTDGLTISNCVRGCDLAGLDPTTQNTAGNAVAHNQDDKVFCQVSAVNFTMMEKALKGDISSGGANWKIGRKKDEDITVTASNGDTNEPFWRYDADYNTTGGWIYSNNGVDSSPFGTGAGVTGGDGITVTVGDIDLDTTDTTVFVKTSSGAGDENKIAVLNASGQLAAGFINSSTFLTFGGDESDGVLNVTSGTTNINSGVHDYSSINVSSGATLSTTSTSGVMRLLVTGDFTLAGTLDLSEKVTASSASAAVDLIGGTFTPTGLKGGNGGGGGGGGNFGTGGAGGAGSGGGAGGNGGASGGGTLGAGGAASGGSTTQGAGGAGVANPGPGGAGGSSAGGGGSGSNVSGGGAGNPGGAGVSGGVVGGSGFGTAGGVAGSGNGAGGGGAGGSGGNGGMDVIINVGGNFTGTGGTIDCSSGTGGAGGAGGGTIVGGGGGGGGKGGTAGAIRLVYKGTYSAATYTVTAGGAGGAGSAGAGSAAAGVAGSAGGAGTAGSSTIVNFSTIPF